MAVENTTLAQVAGVAGQLPAPAHPAGEDFLVSEAATMRQLTVLANTMAKSGFFDDAREAAQAVTKMIIGRSLNIGPVQAMMGITVVKGRPILSANLLASIVRQHPHYDYRVVETNAQACEIEFIRHGRPAGRSRFTLEDAQRAGLLNSNTWKSYPAAMLYARAMSQGCRWYAPDVFGGIPVYTPGEIPGGAEAAPDAPQASIPEASAPPIEAPAPDPAPDDRAEPAPVRKSRGAKLAERLAADSAPAPEAGPAPAALLVDEATGEILDAEVVDPEPAAAPDPQPAPDGDHRLYEVCDQNLWSIFCRKQGNLNPMEGLAVLRPEVVATFAGLSDLSLANRGIRRRPEAAEPADGAEDAA